MLCSVQCIIVPAQVDGGTAFNGYLAGTVQEGYNNPQSWAPA